MNTIKNSTTERNAETLPNTALSLGTAGTTELIVTGRNTTAANTPMKNAVISLLINVLTLALATIFLISLLPLLGRAEPERSEKID
jgi:hypothetical protein